jgi:hypothetical protein
MDKKRRGGLFALIGAVFDRAKADAVAAFNAHFPYLADEKKLAEHARSLAIPRNAADSGSEFRDRVAAAAFYYSHMGERGYILEQLTAHFGDRYVVSESFLNVYVKILDISDKDREWVHSFLDGTLDPNISLTAADWFNFIEEVAARDEIAGLTAFRRDTDIYPSGARYDGRFLCDQGKPLSADGEYAADGRVCGAGISKSVGTVSDTIKLEARADGWHQADGSLRADGYADLYNPLDPALVSAPRLTDETTTGVSAAAFEESHTLRGFYDGFLLCDGRSADFCADALMPARITRLMRCNGGIQPSCTTADGSFLADGSYVFDGLYCAGDIIQEERI